MNALTFRLRLIEPVLVAQAHSGEENSAIGLSFIPGSALRGAMIARYLQANPGIDLLADGEARRLFFDGSVCFLNAYPWRQESRLLPVPRSWFGEKPEVVRDDAKYVDGAMASLDSLQQPKQPPSEFCLLAGQGAALYMPSRQLDVHITLNDPNRRGEGNQVYRYDALAEGEVLSGAVLAEDEDDLEKIKALMVPADIQIGAAHSAGYGRVRIEEPEIDPYWQEYAPGGDPPDGRVVITLLSDAILRDGKGQVNGDLDGWLAARLGRGELRAERCYRRFRLVGGYNRKWGLPLVQSWALQAGSVHTYPAEAGLELDALRALVQRGIGERRAEGFGRVAVNWHTEVGVERYEGVEASPVPEELSPESQLLAWQMAQRRLRLLLDRRLAEAVSRVAVERRPPNAQLSRVRNAVRQALAEGDMRPVLEHLDELKGARDQLEQARVGTASMLHWLRKRATELDVDSELLQGARLPIVAGQAADLTGDLRLVYTARLIDGVMKKAIQRNQEVRS